MIELPTGTVTLLFTDIEGSTRLLERLGDRYVQVLAVHQELLRAAFGQYHGHEVGTEGDGFFVAFAKASDAVAAAVAAQRALAAQPWPDGVALRIRMGIHTGAPIVVAQDYAGLDVHRAARICSAGHGGQALLSQPTRELLGDDLPAGVGLRDLGEHRSKSGCLRPCGTTSAMTNSAYSGPQARHCPWRMPSSMASVANNSHQDVICCRPADCLLLGRANTESVGERVLGYSAEG